MGFSEEDLVDKLENLTPSQQGIETLSHWIIHHRKHAKRVCKIWNRTLQNAKPQMKLPLIYLANDVIQNSKKKGPVYNTEFKAYLLGAFRSTFKTASEKEQKALQRVIKIWIERNVYPANFMSSIKNTASPEAATSPVLTTAKSSKSFEQEESIEDATIPEPEELIKLLNELDTQAASGDAQIREKISKLPSEVQDPSVLETITDIESADRLANIVDEACSLLQTYNARLVKEMEDRNKASNWLTNYVKHQTIHLETEKAELEELKEKLSRVDQVRKELSSHINNLPDLAHLKTSSPLPSVNDLFKPLK